MNKKRILIIEEDYYRCFTWKQLLEVKYNFPVEFVKSGYGEDLRELSKDYNPHKVMYNKGDNVFDFIAKFEEKKFNPVNSRIMLVAKVEDDMRTISRVSNY